MSSQLPKVSMSQKRMPDATEPMPDATEPMPDGTTPGLVRLEKRGPLFVLVLCGDSDGPNPENRWTLPFTRAIHKAFDAVEAALASSERTPAALVTVSDSPKFFSNGIDPSWLMDKATPRAELREWNALVMPAFARPLLLPIPTVCAVDGHGFGAGFMFALGHDYRLMRADRGFLCAPEIA
eukprot:g5794.t1